MAGEDAIQAHKRFGIPSTRHASALKLGNGAPAVRFDP
jgi:hypothetical protein